MKGKNKMEPSETAKSLAKFIVDKSNDAIAGKRSPVEGEEIAQWIEENYGESLVGRLRRKMKNQASNLKQLHRSHAELLHLSRKVLMEKAAQLEIERVRQLEEQEPVPEQVAR